MVYLAYEEMVSTNGISESTNSEIPSVAELHPEITGLPATSFLWNLVERGSSRIRRVAFYNIFLEITSWLYKVFGRHFTKFKVTIAIDTHKPVCGCVRACVFVYRTMYMHCIQWMLHNFERTCVLRQRLLKTTSYKEKVGFWRSWSVKLSGDCGKWELIIA